MSCCWAFHILDIVFNLRHWLQFYSTRTHEKEWDWIFKKAMVFMLLLSFIPVLIIFGYGEQGYSRGYMVCLIANRPGGGEGTIDIWTFFIEMCVITMFGGLMLMYLTYLYARNSVVSKAFLMLADAPKSISYSVGYFVVCVIYLMGRLNVAGNAEGDEEKGTKWANCVFEHYDGVLFDSSSYASECGPFPPGRSPVWAVLISTVISAGQSIWVVCFLRKHLVDMRGKMAEAFDPILGTNFNFNKVVPITSSNNSDRSDQILEQIPMATEELKSSVNELVSSVDELVAADEAAVVDF
jgi:hypothetical protein